MSADGREVTPVALDAHEVKEGALAIIRRLAGIQIAIQWAKVDGSHVFRSHP